MTTKTQRMALILDLAEKDVEAAAAALATAKNRVAAEQLKLDDIISYINDYAESQAEGIRLSPEHMIRQRAFISQLNDAQRQQRLAIAEAERAFEHKKILWQEAHLKQRAMQDLVKRMAEDDAAIANKREEKLMDEWAARQHAASANQHSSKLH